ncbi:NADH-quinone oxidoreductase subunit NuoE [Marinobacter sp. SS13-12]|uniref:NADH-quinone oxidoreductase subunit NuoE n=1 Tax=Marinobacter sp. SS13-12 TaxID=3050451 RepID=UPI00255248C5|nr:NADH-quinone oxidoreductase subunit NuoE [Marinobacter sp. SS13-12]MDK8464779.1 NADH-quinone oxidoreductase subunit NuoE [Marinobacter sp. SS13-12]
MMADTPQTTVLIGSDGFDLDPADETSIIEEMDHYEQPQAACIEALKIVQRRHGWVPDGAITAIARVLGIGPGEVEGVATFYSLIFRQPVGRHVVLVCDSSACFLTGFQELRQALVAQLGIDYGQTTADGRFTLLPVCCLGACDGAPALMIDDDTYGPVSPDDLPGVLEGYP